MQTNDKQMPCPDYSVSYIAEAPECLIGSALHHIAHNKVLWEHRRYEIATSAMQGLIAGGYQWSADAIAKQAVKYADALLAELKSNH